MTPKEKAKELVDNYTVVLLSRRGRSGIQMVLSPITAKQCALIAVDEILKQYKVPTVSHIVTVYKSAEDFNKNFLDIEKQLKDFTSYQILWWNSVKNEIEKL